MATGVLVLGIGRATRLLGYLARTDKGYDATIRLGQATVTDDAEGDLLASRDPSGVTQAAVIAATSALKGRLQQVPSAVSAIKVKGERAYTRVRAGEDVTLPARPVTVSEFAVGELRFGQGTVDLDVHVECSTGTYVRALARDLGAALGVGGHLTALRRTRVGGFDVREAHSPDGLAQLPSELLPVISLDVVARHQFTWCVVDEEDVAGVRNGRSLNQRLPAADEPSVEPAESAHPHEAVRGRTCSRRMRRLSWPTRPRLRRGRAGCIGRGCGGGGVRTGGGLLARWRVPRTLRAARASGKGGRRLRPRHLTLSPT